MAVAYLWKECFFSNRGKRDCAVVSVGFGLRFAAVRVRARMDARKA